MHSPSLLNPHGLVVGSPSNPLLGLPPAAIASPCQLMVTHNLPANQKLQSPPVHGLPQAMQSAEELHNASTVGNSLGFKGIGLIGAYEVWFIASQKMRVFKWFVDFQMEKESLIILVWKYFPNLKVHLLKKSALLTIAKIAGKSLVVDEAMANALGEALRGDAAPKMQIRPDTYGTNISPRTSYGLVASIAYNISIEEDSEMVEEQGACSVIKEHISVPFGAIVGSEDIEVHPSFSC
ncbi:Uncharacterized protein TCM_023428 [Theobroma cacao]|uniref:Uncharacterized protein n=1 Tax=Theobroma cacao TaxID=3641 RepID=A0A061EVD5_THECC|nr:Uncharacterized protein TCM_023428 [Theobroma cacao]